MLMMI
jgi:hypothetical protein